MRHVVANQTASVVLFTDFLGRGLSEAIPYSECNNLAVILSPGEQTSPL